MPKKTYNIDLFSFLRTLHLETFTVTDVTSHLLTRYEGCFDKKKNATQFVYRHLKQLVNDGTLISLPGESGKAILFSWNEKNKKPTVSRQITHDHISTINAADKLAKLKAKIKFYEAEMLAHLGETEAYNEWAEEMPELAQDVKQFHQFTREKAKLMLGKVKGFERLLAYYEDNPS